MKTIGRRMKPAVLALVVSVATVTGMGAGRVSPQNTQRSPQRAPAVQRAKTSSGSVKAPSPVVVRQNAVPPKNVSVPGVPKLKFSNKLAIFLLPKNDKKSQKFIPQDVKEGNEILRAAGPYVPDVIYEKSQLPYAERQRYLKSLERMATIEALDRQISPKVQGKTVLGKPLRDHILGLCSEVLTYGRPVFCLPTQAKTLREAVDLCGMTQLGLWMDIQKVKNREFKDIVPEGYDEKEAYRQMKHLSKLQKIYPVGAYEKAIGMLPENPIHPNVRSFSEEDFVHLRSLEMGELTEMILRLPVTCRTVSVMDAPELYKTYQKIQADKTGYEYVLKNGYAKGAGVEYNKRLQQLALEMVTYRRPLALLRAESYTLEQVMQVCQFKQVKFFYDRQKKGVTMPGVFLNQEERGITKKEADALIVLGKRFNHPDWVQFGENMNKEIQTFRVLGSDRVLGSEEWADSVNMQKSAKPETITQNAPKVPQPTNQEQKPASGNQGQTSASGGVKQDAESSQKISVSNVPELKFSNKLSVFIAPFGDMGSRHYILQNIGKGNEILRVAGPYVPDVIYEKSQLPYAERKKFRESPEKRAIMEALERQISPKVQGQTVLDKPLMGQIVGLCDEILIYGRPISSVRMQAETLREAVDLCGLTQLGHWLDIQKAQNRELKKITPPGYNPKEAHKQLDYLSGLHRMYPVTAYSETVGLAPEDPISPQCHFFSEADCAHLSPKEKKELLKMMRYLPVVCRDAPLLNTSEVYKEYQKIQADETGYGYIRQYGKSPKISVEYDMKLQELALEMVTYRRPLALLHAENYTLEQVMMACQFHSAEKFYRRQQSKNKKKGRICEEALVMYNREADALVTLGKKFNHPDWIKFGQEMYEEGKTFENTGKYKGFVQKHDDSQMIQNQLAQVSDVPRVRHQDGSTNTTSRIEREAGKGAK